MVTWQRFAADSPQLAEEVRARLVAVEHHILATIRRDGSPRVSGTEVRWRGDELELGSMPDAWKARDLRRDARCAIHSNPGDASLVPMDVKLSGRAIEVVDPAEHRAWVEEVRPPSPDSHLFRLDITEVSTTDVSEGYMLIKLWRPDRGLVAFKREGGQELIINPPRS